MSSVLTWCASFCLTPASAQTITDPTFGLSVTPPEGYAATLVTLMPSNKAIIAVMRRQPDNAGCLIEFERDQTNNGWTQAYFNNRADKTEWIEQVRVEISARYDIHNIEPIEQDGVRGTAFAGDKQYDRPKNVNSMPKPTREWYVILDTVKGRVTMECSAPRPEFEDRKAEFVAILRTIALPK